MCGRETHKAVLSSSVQVSPLPFSFVLLSPCAGEMVKYVKFLTSKRFSVTHAMTLAHFFFRTDGLMMCGHILAVPTDLQACHQYSLMFGLTLSSFLFLLGFFLRVRIF